MNTFVEYQHMNLQGDRFDVPSKSKETIRTSAVGVTDIHTPSVVRIADPAKEVSTRWFKEKLFPTDCSPIDDTTLTGLKVI